MAQLYNVAEADFAGVYSQLTVILLATDDTGQVRGVLGLRPSPAHGAEVMGGALDSDKREVSMALLKAALQKQPQLYAYAEEDRFSEEVLKAAGLWQASAYTRMSGRILARPSHTPAGFRLIPLSEVWNPAERRTAQETYSDLIGHTFVTEESIQPNTGGSDDTLGLLAFNAAGEAVGVCRVWREGNKISITLPGIRRDLRATELQIEMLNRIFLTAQEQGIPEVEISAWGEDLQNVVAKMELRLALEDQTPIYASRA